MSCENQRSRVLKMYKFDSAGATYFEVNVFFGATSIEEQMTLWSTLSACKSDDIYKWIFFSIHPSVLTFIHLKEQYFAEQDGQVQVSCFCLKIH